MTETINDPGTSEQRAGEQSTGTKLGERRSSARAEAAPAYRARREEIIAAAGQAFLAKGYRATSFRDIADAVGVDRASLYYYCLLYTSPSPRDS